MKKIYLLLFFTASTLTYSQTARTKEYYELGATEYILEIHPAVTDFQLKLGDDQVEKKNDLSGTTVRSYEIIDYTNAFSSPNILLEMKTGLWVNREGLTYQNTFFTYLSREEWLEIFKTYCNIALGLNTQIENPWEVKSLNKKSTHPLVKLRLSPVGLVSGVKSHLPFVKIGGDHYRVSASDLQLEDDYRLVYNEKSLGLFHKKTGKLFQLSRSSINQIQSFFEDN